MPNSNLAIFADDQYEIFLNGIQISANANSWYSGISDQIGLQLDPGNYVLAVKVIDGNIRGGLAAAIQRGTSTLLTNGSWRVSSEEVANWNSLGLDDSNWKLAADTGYGWAEQYWQKAIETSANGAQAKWIWHPDFLANPTDPSNPVTIYFRRTFTVDAEGLIVSSSDGSAPVASIRAATFDSVEPGQSRIPPINIGQNFNGLIDLSNADKALITSLSFKTSLSNDSGYFQWRDNGLETPILAREFEVSSADIQKLEWVPGPLGTFNGISVRATDRRGGIGAWSAEATWKTPDRLGIVVDNSYKVWLDGTLRGESQNSWGSGIDFFDVETLQPGTHVLAIEGSDTGGVAGALAGLAYRNSSLGTSRAWRISTQEVTGWQELGFDDSTWNYVKQDSSIWDGYGWVNRSSFVVPTAQWIWDDDLENTDRAFLRVKFEIDANGQIIQSAPANNRPPNAFVYSQWPSPGQRINVGQTFSSLFYVNDPDGDLITEYEFFDSNPSADSGYFQRLSSSERMGTQFSFKAKDLSDLEWVSGSAHTSDGIRLKAKDLFGITNEWQDANVIWRSNQAPVVSVLPQRFRPGQQINIGQTFHSLFSVSDPEGDPITDYEFFDSNSSDNSGYFHRISTNEIYYGGQFSIKSEDLNDLEWVAGVTNASDGIRLKATDLYGAINEWQPENSIWSARRRLGINSPVVAEGEIIPFRISREDEINQALTLYLEISSDTDWNRLMIEDAEFREWVNRGSRIPLTFSEGQTSLDLNYFRIRRNNRVETESYPVLDISIYADSHGGEPISGSIAKATDANLPPVGIPRLSDRVERSSSRTNTTLTLADLVWNYYSFSDPDGDRYDDFYYIISQTSTDPGAGYWTQPDGTVPQGFSHNFTTPVLSWEALQNHTYTFVGGRRTSQTISVRAADSRGAFSEPMTLTFNVHQAPVVHLSSPGFSWTLAGVPRPFNDWLTIGNDPDGDTIQIFTYADRTTDPLSGYFMLDGEKINADAEKINLISPEDINRLMWVPGKPLTQDTIELRVQDSNGDVGSATATFSTGRGPTGYMISNTNGFNHVTEGNTFSLNIAKLANFDQTTTLKWAIFGKSANLSGSREDFSGVAAGWNSISFNANAPTPTVQLNLQTLKDKSEGSETARIWFYNEELNRGNRDRMLDSTQLLGMSEGQLKNIGYSYLDVSIHDKTIYVLEPTSKTYTEGETATLRVARFGGGPTAKSSVTIKAQGIQQLIPASKATDKKNYQSVKGMAIGGAAKTAGIDFEQVAPTLSFNGDEIKPVQTRLIADSVREDGGEVFAWSLYTNSKTTPSDTRLVTILDNQSFSLRNFNLQGVWDVFAAVGGFFASIPAAIGAVAQNTGAFIQSLLSPQQPVVRLNTPGSQLSLIKTPQGLVGHQIGAFTIQGDGNLDLLIRDGLVAQGGANLVAQGGANFGNQLVNQLVAQGGANLVPNDLGALIRNSVGALVAQGGANLVAQGGANLQTSLTRELSAQGPDGANLVAQGGANLVATAIDTLKNRGDASLVAQGGANLNELIFAELDTLVAQGGANLNRNLIGNAIDRLVGKLVAQGGANLVSQGGANLSLSDQINTLVAQGGANLVAQGGANLVPDGFGLQIGNAVDKLIAQNLVAQGGANLSTIILNLVAQGGANLVAQGGANLRNAIDQLITQGGANLVAQGGANLAGAIATAALQVQGGAQLVIQNRGNLLSSIPINGLGGLTVLPDNQQMYISSNSGMTASDASYAGLSNLRDLNNNSLVNPGSAM